MLEISKVAAYRPTGRVDGWPRAGWDEDAFTLGVAAIERLADGAGALGSPSRILLVGTFPASVEANLLRYFGAAIPVERTGIGAAGLDAALERLGSSGGDSAPVLLLAADVAADRSDSTATPAAPAPDAAVAAWWDHGGIAAAELRSAARDAASDVATAPFFALHRARSNATPERWRGEWLSLASSGSGAAGALRARPTIPSGGPVSQGAYVPLPRYEENLPSRWRFAAERCSSCGAISFPVRGQCRRCARRDTLERTFLPTDGGLVLATTTIAPGGQPTEFDDQVAAGGPYEVALVELVPEVGVTLQVTDITPGALRIGDRVRTSLRRLYPMEGDWRYGRKAIRAAAPSA